MSNRNHKVVAFASPIAEQCGGQLVAVCLTGKAHIKLTFARADGVTFIYFMAGTPSDWRTERNTRAGIRRMFAGREAR